MRAPSTESLIQQTLDILKGSNGANCEGVLNLINQAFLATQGVAIVPGLDHVRLELQRFIQAQNGH